MTRKEALAELIATVEAGTPYETAGHTMMCQRAFPKPDDFDGSREAYANSPAQKAILAWRNDDLNAALALHQAVLHESVTKQEVWSKRYGGTVELSHRGHVISQASNIDGTPARAWLLAILKVLNEMETEQ